MVGRDHQKQILESLMNPVTALRARLWARSDGEHEQAIIRIVLLGLSTIYVWGLAAAGPVVAERTLHRLGLDGLDDHFADVCFDTA
jgi:hypothetical protein